MTELKISVRLDADGRAYVASIDAAGKATGEYKKVVTESGKAAKAAAAEVKAAAREKAQAEKEAAAAAKAAAREQAAAQREAQGAANKTRMGYAQLGQQVQDFGIQVGGGVPIIRAFTQQMGQAAFVMQGVGGQAGKIAEFFAGPWGTGLTLALVAVDLLTSGLLNNEEQTKKTEKASRSYADVLQDEKASIEEVVRASDEYVAARKKEDQIKIEGLRKTAAVIAANLKEAASTREKTKAQLEFFRATLNDPTLPLGDNRAIVNQKTVALDAQLAAQDDLIKSLGESAAQVSRDVAQEIAKLSSDQEYQIRTGYDLLRQRALSTIKDTKAAAAELTRLNKEEEKRLAAVNKTKRSSGSGSTPSGDLTRFGLPIAGARITSGFGMRTPPTAGASSNHMGVDFAAAIGTAVRATADGFIQFARTSGGYGNQIRVNHGAGTETRYSHLSRFALPEGSRVSKGDIIGYSGKTGISRGPHLHYEVLVNGKKVDPTKGLFGTDTADVDRAVQKQGEQLAKMFEDVVRAVDPAEAALAKYRDTLASIDQLLAAKKISPEQAARLRTDAGLASIEAEAKAWDDQVKTTVSQLGPVFQQAMDKPVDIVGVNFKANMVDGAQAAADTLQQGSLTAAQAFAQIIGGRTGNNIASMLGALEGAQSGNFNSVGGRLGGLLTLFGGGGGVKASGDPVSQALSIANRDVRAAGLGPSGFGGGVSEFSADLKKTFKGIFGDTGPFSGTLGKTLGKAFAGAQFGGAIGKGVTSALGIRGSKAGGQLGGALGGAIGGPLGAAIGGTLGSIVGGLFKKSKTGSTSIGFVDGALGLGSTTGNSQAFKDQSKGLAQSIMGNLTTLADQLGAVITGAPTVSVGIRNGKPVVDTSGQNRTKGAGVVKFKKGEEEAAAAFAQKEALKDLLSDGFIQGLSARVKSALQSSDDLDKALREALKVDEIERLLDGFGGMAKKAFVDFERQAKERLRIAGKYGFDLVKLEELNAKERTKLFESAVESAVGSLRNLLEDLTTGERAPGTLLDRRDALIAKRDSLLATAATDADAANKLADVLNQLDQVNLEAFGTAGAQFASDRAGIKSTAQAIIEQATADLKAAQDKAMSNAGTSADVTAKAIADANAGVVSALDENNAQNAQIIAALNKLTMSAITSVGGGGSSAIVQALQLGLNYK